MSNRYFLLAYLSCFYFIVLHAARTSVEVFSPDSSLEVNLFTDSNNQPCYRVFKNKELLVSDSHLGISTASTGQLYNNFSNGIIESTKQTINETYHLLHGKTSIINNHYNELITVFEGKGGRCLTIIFRVSNDMVAFRYMTNITNQDTFTGEATEFNIARFGNSWAQSYVKDYSWYYLPRTWDALTDADGYCEPILIQTKSANTYILLTEAEALSSTSASKIIKGGTFGSLKLSLFGGSIMDSTFITPWRTMIIGSLPNIVESNAVTNLTDHPNNSADYSWVVPGRASWNWGGEDTNNSISEDIIRKYADYAAYMGWEYCLVDDGWEGKIDLKKFVQYCNQQNVSVLVWANQNHFDNNDSDIASWLNAWAGMGVKGVKVDFFEDDSQKMLSKYEKILQAAANAHLVVDFHGCTRPSGLERRWPNLLTSEAVLGGEFYLTNENMTPGKHLVNLILIRNVLGGMDFTPCKFGTKTGKVKQNNSWAQELALMIAFESGIQCSSDCPENLKYNIAEPLLRQLPVAWDEIRCVEAAPDQYATIARRKGTTWYVAGITQNAREMKLKPSFLDSGKKYTAYLYKDGSCRYDIAVQKINDITSNDSIPIQLFQNGGCTIIFSTDENMPMSQAAVYEAENFNFFGRKTVDLLCSNGQYVSSLTGRAQVKFSVSAPEEGQYAITLYFLSDSERSAYLQINNGDKMYHDFINTGSVNGGNVGFKTILVNLLKGDNTITYGNENDQTPALDRIILNPTFSVNNPTGLKDLPKFTINKNITQSGNAIVIHSEYGGKITLYSISGKILLQKEIQVGETQIPIPISGFVIVNLVEGTKSYSQKIIIK